MFMSPVFRAVPGTSWTRQIFEWWDGSKGLDMEPFKPAESQDAGQVVNFIDKVTEENHRRAGERIIESHIEAVKDCGKITGF